MKPPPLKDDCFAMPPGLDWTPVDQALEKLLANLHTVVGQKELPVRHVLGRVLSLDVFAQNAHPPFANSAVDGFGFAFDSLPAKQVLTLPRSRGRAAAGAAYDGIVAPGSAIRILTGARIPRGVDTVVLEEDCSVEDHRITFREGIRKGANTRLAGEDVQKGSKIFDAGHKLAPQDLGLLASCGVKQVNVCDLLKVGVLSTGDEIVPIEEHGVEGRIYDANRPMLGAMLTRWGYQVTDLGHVKDDREELHSRLSNAAGVVDAILTSGGASGGDEDHVSALLAAQGRVSNWRIAMKPGRPLMLGLWRGVPVFGLPGNPVAAFVCTMIFARPALAVLSGETDYALRSFRVPAAFSKNKKPGRREYLRARMNKDGHAEVFASEGSGRISGLSWASGLVELGDEAQEITPGDMVQFLPFG